MNTFKFQFLMLAIVAVCSCLTSCSKDNDNDLETQESLIGKWEVSKGIATIFENGEELASGNITTDGEIEFQSNGNGSVDFTMTFDGETDEIVGNFTWTREGNEILVNDGDDIVRWKITQDNENQKNVQMDIPLEYDVQFDLTLNRK